MTFLNDLRLKYKMIVLSSIICCTVIITGTFLTVVLEKQKHVVVSDVNRILARNASIVSFSLLAKDILYDTSQVQQWLSDISATRGQDGYNDGFNQAGQYAQQFDSQIEEAIGLAKKLQMPEVITTLHKAKQAFPIFYGTGIKMAHKYIDSGPHVGNNMMAEFDKEAKAINIETQQLLKLSSTALNNQNRQMVKDIASVNRSLTLVEKLNFVGTLFILIISIVSVFLIQKIVGQPLNKLSDSMLSLADGEDNVDLPMSMRKDEIGDMSNTLQIFQEKLLKNKQLEKEAEKSRQEQEERQKLRLENEKQEALRRHEEEKNTAEKAEKIRMAERHDMAQKFENRVSGVLDSVSSAAAELNATSVSMSTSASTMKNESLSAAAATMQAGRNVQIVASSSEEMTASVNDISGQLKNASMATQTALNSVNNASTRVTQMADSSSKITEIIMLINDIAEQTNLLALNATIEAARAGDAGRGFAVVASEVKNLASQTAAATDEIRLQINAMQTTTNDTVSAVQEISTTIKSLDEISSSISITIEQQVAAMQEINRNALEAANGTESAGENANNVSQLAEETGDAAADVLSASSELSCQASTLQVAVGEFLNDIRTG